MPRQEERDDEDKSYDDDDDDDKLGLQEMVRQSYYRVTSTEISRGSWVGHHRETFVGVVAVARKRERERERER